MKNVFQKIHKKAFQSVTSCCIIYVAYQRRVRLRRVHGNVKLRPDREGDDVTQVWETLENYVWTILHRPRLNDILDILLVAAIVYKLLMLTRDTRGSAVLKGLLLLLLVVGVSNFFGLTALNWLLTAVVNNGPLVLVILFQPEIRKALESIGRGARLEKVRSDSEDEAGHIVSEIVQCLLSLSRRRVGALIVFEQKTGLQDVIENGIGMDAQISAGLLENIFEPNTPLHDGAVVIRDRRIMSAASFLSLTDASGISHDLGTRHRAALGVSETTDALVLIVSEETGIISMARGGKLTRYLDQKALRGILEGLYNPQRGSRLLQKLFARKGDRPARDGKAPKGKEGEK